METEPSSNAEASAARWGYANPEDEPAPLAPPSVPEADDVVPNRHSASAEAAALRWHERQDSGETSG
jgi:hypothetical protein